MKQEDKDLLLQIPKKLDDTVRLYVDGVFVERNKSRFIEDCIIDYSYITEE